MRKTVGQIIIKNGVNVWDHEMFIAKAVANIGYDVTFIPASNSTHSADAYLNNTIFEFKAPEGSTVKAIERNLVKALTNQSPNIVVTSYRMKKIQDRSIKSFLAGRLRDGKGIKRLIFVNRSGQAVDIKDLI